MLYCYVHFFSTYSFVVLLSDTYNGNDFQASYAYDVVRNVDVTKSIKLTLTKQEVKNILNKTGWQDSAEMVVKKMNRVMGLASKRHSDEAINDITSNAIEKIFAQKYGHEPVITEQMVKEFSAEVADNFVRFMYRGKGMK